VEEEKEIFLKYDATFFTLREKPSAKNGRENLL
jgi:hypothetical protein